MAWRRVDRNADEGAWDACEAAHRPGSLDTSIDVESMPPNDFESFLTSYCQLRLICFNGANAENFMIRILSFVFLAAFATQAFADDALWQRLKTEGGLIVLMRHAEPAGGNGLTWDESGNCKNEPMLTAGGKAHAKRIGEAFASRGIKPAVISSPMCRCRDTAQIAFGENPLTDGALREIASADSERAKLFERTAQSLINSRRGRAPVVFVSHRPNIDLLTMELIDSGELLVGRVNDRGDIDVQGKIKVQ
jgi:phosphohistidine phosphatase SixA